MLPAPVTRSALACVRTRTVTHPALQGATSRAFTWEARPVVVDRADKVLPDGRGPILVTLGLRFVVLPEQELEHAQYAVSFPSREAAKCKKPKLSQPTQATKPSRDCKGGRGNNIGANQDPTDDK